MSSIAEGAAAEAVGSQPVEFHGGRLVLRLPAVFLATTAYVAGTRVVAVGACRAACNRRPGLKPRGAQFAGDPRSLS